MSIFDDHFDAIANAALFSGPDQLELRYQHKSAERALAPGNQTRVDGYRLVAELFAHVQKRLAGEIYGPSRHNWRLRPFEPSRSRTSDSNASDEVNLERAIAERWPDEWFYQTPIASGLLGPHVDKRRAVDLIHRNDEVSFDLVELKVRSNTPLYAAIEILGYGLVYLATRLEPGRLLHPQNTTLPLITARNITLVVLAPVDFYAGPDLSCLQPKLAEGLRTLVESQGLADLTMDFRFEQFADDWADSTAIGNIAGPFPRNPAASL